MEETSNPVSFTPLPLPDSPILVSRFRVKGSGSAGFRRGLGGGCRPASAGAAGAVFLLLLEFIYTHHTRAAAELPK